MRFVSSFARLPLRPTNMVLTNFNFRATKALYLIVALSTVIDFYSTEFTESRMKESNGRYLVYPTPGTFAPTKVQLIVGLGLPMEVDVSMIVGYVMKFNYVLPYNASYVTHPNVVRYDRSIDPRSILRRRAIENEKEEEGWEREEEGVTVPSADEEEDEGGSISRWEMYKVIVTALDSFQLSGKSCLLKTVCQVAEVPFDDSRAGLVAQLIHVFLIPSTTREKYKSNGDQEYHAAEAAGKEYPGKCEIIFPECQHNLLEYFTETNEIYDSVEMFNV